jgi:hypothetical protein
VVSEETLEVEEEVAVEVSEAEIAIEMTGEIDQKETTDTKYSERTLIPILKLVLEVPCLLCCASYL